ncbi:MAG: FAD-dependent oxidoreductase [Propioniciclava sp.]|uniref:FAD-dependent oxidoreductase n=1 Tax=Propioniciclava sp. TaxID=2038686 RepID=UPI0039E65D87
MTPPYPGRDTRAVRLRAETGADHVGSPRSVLVVGGGIAGLAAAMGLAERGVQVRLVEREHELGGRVRAWRTQIGADPVTMSRGFHAFFRQYYNLRALLSRAGSLDSLLRPIEDYPVVSGGGDRDSFTSIPRTPPFNFITFVAKSPTFQMRELRRVNLDSALSLLDVSFPQTFRELENQSAAEFLDRLRFPPRARHLALEVFARSFFADPREFSAGELVAMFHSYFLGSAEGLLFDVPRDDYDTSLWSPLGKALEREGAQRVTGEVVRLERSDARDLPGASPRWRALLADGSPLEADAVVLAAGPDQTPGIVARSPEVGDQDWRRRVAGVRLAPAFAVWRLWIDRPLHPDRAPFLGTAGFGPLDNISVLDRFEDGAAAWARQRGGSVIELHAYAIAEDRDPEALRTELLHQLARVYPEAAQVRVLGEQWLVERDCALAGIGPWDDKPGVSTPEPGIKLAGDWVRSDLPIALMERAATTGWMAANQLLTGWGVAGHDLWSVPLNARQQWPGQLRRLLTHRSRSRS